MSAISANERFTHAGIPVCAVHAPRLETKKNEQQAMDLLQPSVSEPMPMSSPLPSPLPTPILVPSDRGPVFLTGIAVRACRRLPLVMGGGR